MHPTIEKALTGKPVILDGAWGTQLQELGLEAGMCPEEWNLSQADKIIKVATSYVQAGSKVILTNSFGGNSIRLGEFGLADKAAEINTRAVKISRQAADTQDGVMVFASMGPTGKMLMMGDVTEDELLKVFTEQAEALAAGSPDALVLETLTRSNHVYSSCIL